MKKDIVGLNPFTKIFGITVIIVILFSCQKDDKNNLENKVIKIDWGDISKKPKNLSECYHKLDSLLPDSIKKKIRNSIDVDIMTDFHFSLGLYIRNNWIRHGNSLLEKSINDSNYDISIDDLGGVILDGYWHYLHKKKFDYRKKLENAEFYYRGVEEPTENIIPKNVHLKKTNEISLFDIGDSCYSIHSYNILNNHDYYIYVYPWGWKRITQNIYKKLRNVNQRTTTIKKIYNK